MFVSGQLAVEPVNARPACPTAGSKRAGQLTAVLRRGSRPELVVDTHRPRADADVFAGFNELHVACFPSDPAGPHDD
jgi:hypothetical protein